MFINKKILLILIKISQRKSWWPSIEEAWDPNLSVLGTSSIPVHSGLLENPAWNPPVWIKCKAFFSLPKHWVPISDLSAQMGPFLCSMDTDFRLPIQSHIPLRQQWFTGCVHPLLLIFLISDSNHHLWEIKLRLPVHLCDCRLLLCLLNRKLSCVSKCCFPH